MFIYTSEEIRTIDQEAERKGMPPFTLMEVAGRGLFEAIEPLVSKDSTILVIAGKGNNGGDAICLARYLLNAGFLVKLVCPLGEPKTDAAKKHLAYYKSCGYSVWEHGDGPFATDAIIEGLLGVGSRLPLRETVRPLTQWINQQNATIISIDCPTGVDSDTGAVDDDAVKADYTYALHGYKPSVFLEPAARFYGKTDTIEIGLKQSSNWKVWTESEVSQTILKREKTSHKGSFGTGLLLAGEEEMPGSAALAAIGGLRFGIGKLTIATSRETARIIGTLAPEATFFYSNPQEIQFTNYSAVAIGPGSVPSQALEERIGELLHMDRPLVLDAGALSKRDYIKREAPIVLTPHPGEFSRMTGYSTSFIQEHRIKVAKEYAVEQQVTVVLKGSSTVIAYPDGTGVINSTGNPSLAKGGSGDTLTGMLLASLASYKDYKVAVANAVFIHGLCADYWVEQFGEATLVAHDFAKLLPRVLKTFDLS